MRTSCPETPSTVTGSGETLIVKCSYLLPQQLSEHGTPGRFARTRAFWAIAPASGEEGGLPKLDGSLWHAYRRAWATRRNSLPTVDAAAAGGLTDVGTLLRCYQQPDDATMLAVMSHQQTPIEQQKGS